MSEITKWLILESVFFQFHLQQKEFDYLISLGKLFHNSPTI